MFRNHENTWSEIYTRVCPGFAYGDNPSGLLLTNTCLFVIRNVSQPTLFFLDYFLLFFFKVFFFVGHIHLSYLGVTAEADVM